jgi:hypothetical protein
MSDKQEFYVVTKDGHKVSPPMSESEARQKAAEMKTLLESAGQTANISVVSVILG